MGKKYKIKYNPKDCIGCAACVSACESNWEMDDSNKSRPKKKVIDEKELACNKEAADVCPVELIKIEPEK